MTKRRLTIEVEPLSSRRWAEIERNVLERAAEPARPPAPRSLPPPSRPSLFVVGFGALAVAAALLIAWLSPPGAHDRQASTQTPSEVPIVTGRIVTESAATHTTAGDVAIDVEAQSSLLILERSHDAWLVSIEHGGAWFRVPPRHGRPRFVVEAGLVRVEVIGTRFRVAREPGSATAEVEVEAGTVRVVSGGEETSVHEGERWPTRTAALEPAPALAEPGPGRDPGEALPPEARERAVRAARTGPPASEVGEAQEAPVVPPAAAPEAVVAVPTPRERFARAESLERSEPATALAEYRALAADGGPWGANALFAEGRLELELGRRERSRALLERYLQLYPGGLNVEDAQTLLDRTR